MKKKFSLWTSLFLVLSLVVGFFSPVVANAQNVETTVVIHKLQMSTLPSAPIPHDGTEITDLTKIASDAKALPGVTFSIYRLTDQNTNMEEAAKGDLSKIQHDSEAKFTGVTGNEGTVSTKLADGKYIVKEEGKPDTVSASLAVPFLLELPVFGAEANGASDRLATVHVYPKNQTSDLPEVDKSVDDFSKQSSGKNIGDEFTWFLKTTIPSNIADYEKFELSDTLSASLTYKGIGEVRVGDTVLVKGEDYTVTESPVDTKGGNATIALTKAGMKKIGGLGYTYLPASGLTNPTANNAAGAFLSVELKAEINEDAALGTPIKNQFTLTFDNTPNGENDPKDPKESDEPEVHTGGRKFKKVDGANNENTLKGAEFELYTADGKAVVWTPELLAANLDKVERAEEGATVTVKSGAEGAFAIKGLAYEEAGTEYYLKETKAPEGYVVPSANEKITFTVTATSHADSTEALKIENTKKPNIPNTGGIGSVIFVVIGLGLMSAAVYGYKRFAN